MLWIKAIALSFCLILVSSQIVVRAQENASGAAVTAEAFRAINVRSGPSMGYAVTAQLDAGDVVRVIGKNDEGNNWLLVEIGEQTGWVAYFTVTVSGDPNTLPIIEIEPVGEITETADYQASLRRAETDYFVTAYRRVNVRMGPGTDYDILGVLIPGDTADIIAISDNAEWLQIDFDEQPGWVAYFVVTITGASDVPVEGVSALSALTADPSATDAVRESAPDQFVSIPDRSQNFDELAAPAAESFGLPVNTVITRFNISLRALPDMETELVGAVPFDTPLTVEARTADRSWLRVTYGDVTGWLVTSLVDFSTVDLNGVPVAEESAE